MSTKPWDEDYDLTDPPPENFYLDCGCWSGQADHTCTSREPRPDHDE